jgi:hypothetical protein
MTILTWIGGGNNQASPALHAGFVATRALHERCGSEPLFGRFLGPSRLWIPVLRHASGRMIGELQLTMVSTSSS